MFIFFIIWNITKNPEEQLEKKDRGQGMEGNSGTSACPLMDSVVWRYLHPFRAF